MNIYLWQRSVFNQLISSVPEIKYLIAQIQPTWKNQIFVFEGAHVLSSITLMLDREESPTGEYKEESSLFAYSIGSQNSLCTFTCIYLIGTMKKNTCLRQSSTFFTFSFIQFFESLNGVFSDVLWNPT